jgi:hypothetical protein
MVCQLFPHTLRFWLLPYDWMRGRFVQTDNADGTGYQACVLRFNGARDVVVFRATWEDQVAAIRICQFRGTPLDDFLQMRHVAISISEMRSVTRWNFYCSTGCQCLTEECQDYCKKEPLPKFLELFPRLQTFYVAGVPKCSIHLLGDAILPRDPPFGEANCPCPASGLRHAWPTIRCPTACGTFTPAFFALRLCSRTLAVCLYLDDHFGSSASLLDL